MFVLLRGSLGLRPDRFTKLAIRAARKAYVDKLAAEFLNGTWPKGKKPPRGLMRDA